ncbi:MAG: YHS domain-containing (seleno)protein [Pseudomonadota bacterium]
MIKHIKKAALGVSMLALTAAPSFAGEQYVDPTGFAVSGYDVVAYFDLEQAPFGEKQPAAVPGKSSISAEWNGAKFAFSSVENRERFLANPEKYAPQYDGHCAFGVKMGLKVPSHPDLWRIVDGKLYLNIRQKVVALWEEDVPGSIVEADTKWKELEAAPASDMAVPDFEIANAPVKEAAAVYGTH